MKAGLLQTVLVVCTLLSGNLWLVGAERPNIVLIVADDLGYADVGIYGNPRNATPAIDQLAREGMMLTDFHANGATCSPTRAALMSGLYQQRLGIEGPLDIGELGMPPRVETLAERLQATGYRTAALGKWHLGNLAASNPVHHGFDVFRGHLTSATDYKSHIDREGNYDWFDNEEVNRHGKYNTIAITEDAVTFLGKRRQQPFFLYISHSAIHFPWMSPMDPAYRKEGMDYSDGLVKLGPRDVDQDVSSVVQAMVESLDDSVGRVMEALKVNGLDENTLVIFTSDNGGYLDYKGMHKGEISNNGPFRGEKGSLFEGGHRVPFIVRWPRVIRSGQMTRETALTIDLVPTLLNVAGAGDFSSTEALDGVNMLPLLLENEPLADRLLFWAREDAAAVRSGDWKLIHPKEKTPLLFNLRSDPGESKNLASAYPGVVSELGEALEVWKRDVKSSFNRKLSTNSNRAGGKTP